jgi:YD repeat-containing protein
LVRDEDRRQAKLAFDIRFCRGNHRGDARSQSPSRYTGSTTTHGWQRSPRLRPWLCSSLTRTAAPILQRSAYRCSRPINGSTKNFYDKQSNLTASVTPNGGTSYTFYDLDNRVTSTVDSLGTSISTGYDGDGNVTKSISAIGGVTTTSYDNKMDDPTEIINPIGGNFPQRGRFSSFIRFAGRIRQFRWRHRYNSALERKLTGRLRFAPNDELFVERNHVVKKNPEHSTRLTPAVR